MINEEELYGKAVEMWGVESQLNMVVEECLELALAIKHVQRGRGSYYHVIEEMVDVEIMLGQLRIMLGDHYSDSTKFWKVRKLMRLQTMLNEPSRIVKE